jgi:hypothetical protein
VIVTPVQAPRANAVCERFLGSVRRDCVDHTLVLGERHLQRVLAEYVGYFNRARPHQAIKQRTPTVDETSVPPRRTAVTCHRASRGVIAVPVLGGLHHEYRAAA